MNKVTCLILNYNDVVTTINMVKKIVDYKHLDNILIVDNASTDNSYTCLVRYFNSYDNVTVINSGKNGGYGFGNNYGIKYAKSKLNAKYVIISNPDVSFSDKLVKKLLVVLKEKDAAIVSGTQIMDKEKADFSAWNIPTAFQWTFIETKFFRKYTTSYRYPSEYFNSDITKVACVRGAMFLVDINKFLSVGGYDEEMFLFGEETLIGYKFRQKKYATYILNKEYYYHQHSTTINKNIPNLIKKEKIMQNSKLIFLKKYLRINKLEYIFLKSVFKGKLIKMKIKGLLSSK